MKKFNYVLLLVLVLLVSNRAVACMMCHGGEHTQHEVKKTKSDKFQVESVTTATPKLNEAPLTITGTLICTSCQLKQKGAKSQCSVYGCSYSIKTKNVRNHKGELVKKYVGKVYQILANDTSSALFKKEYKGKDVIIVGKIYTEENVVEVDFVKLAVEKNIYTCPMCGGEFDKPGKCPKCGMDLVPVKN